MLRLPLGLALFALYCWTAAPAAGFGDSVFFALACAHADIAHAPGYPLYSLLCRPFALLPLNPAAAAAVFSAACAAAACVVLAMSAARLCGDRRIAALAAALYGVSAGFWAQATVPEVYALNALLFLGAFELALRLRQKPSVPLFYALALVCALGLSAHWPLFVLAGLSLPFVLAPVRGAVWGYLARPKTAATAAALVFAGLSPYVYLVWRTNNPGVFLGLPFAVGDFSSFWEIVSRAVHRASDEQGGGWADKTAYLWFLGGEVFWRQFTALGGALVAAGFVLQWRKLPVSAAAALCVLFLGGGAGLVFLLDFVDNAEQRQTFLAYPLLPFAAACVWAAVAAAHFRRAGAAVLAAAVLAAAAVNFADNNRREDRTAEEIVRAYFRMVPAGAAWIPPPEWFDFARYLQITENLRPDVWALPPPNPLAAEMDFGGRRLYPPNALDYPEELRRVAGFAEHNAVCYNTYLPPADHWHTAEYFVFSCKSEKPEVVYAPAAAELLRFVLSAPPPKSLAGQNAAGQIVENAARTMLRLEARRELPEAWRNLLAEAKKSPDGLLAELEFLSAAPDLVVSEKRAAQYARAAETALPALVRPRALRLLMAAGTLYAAASPQTETSRAAAKALYARAENLLTPKGAFLFAPKILAFYRRESMRAEEQAFIAKYGELAAGN